MIADQEFAKLAAEAVLRKLDAQQYAHHNKHMVDYLPEDARWSLFRGLDSLATAQTSIKLEGKHPRSIKLVPRQGYDLLPFLVVDEGDAESQSSNVGTEGFASSLRDFFSEGANQTRVLLVLTPGGNETQRSARDAADKELIGLRSLCDALARRRDFDGDKALDDIIDTFLDYTYRLTWSERLARLQDFLDAIRDEPDVSKWGAELPRLGCFFPDSSPDPIRGPLPDLKRSVNDRRLGERSRIRTNGAAFLAANEILEDSLQPDKRSALKKLLDDDTATALAEGGGDSFHDVDFERVEGPSSARIDGNRFEFDIPGRPPVIDGALAHHWLASDDAMRADRSSDRTSQMLIITANSSVRLHIPLRFRHDEEQRGHLRVIGWSGERYASIDGTATASADGMVGVFDLVPPDEGMAVFRIAVSKGPRSYKTFQDEFIAVISRSDSPSVAWEMGGRVSIEHQAWVREGDSAQFQVRRGTKEIVREAVSLNSFDYDPADAPTDSREIDSVITAVTNDVLLDEGRLQVSICWTESVEDASDDICPLLETAVYRLKGEQQARLFRALKVRRGEDLRYLDSITDFNRDPAGFWNLEVGQKVRVRCRANNERRQEEAVALLLDASSTMRIDAVAGEWSKIGFPDTPELGELLAARNELFGELRQRAIRHIDMEGGRAYVSLQLTNLAPFEPLIDRYLDSWNRVFETSAQEVAAFSQVHAALVEMDTLVLRDEGGTVARLLVLPTHPWVLRSLLSFQKIADEAFQRASAPSDLKKSQLSEEEFMQLAATKVLEHWYFERDHFRAGDGVPFTFDFVPARNYVHEAHLDYVSRVVQKKLDRYMRMHSHLADSRRTLRIGFVNPGDAHHLLAGITAWLKTSRDGAQDDYELWLAKTPQIEVLLFEGGADERAPANELDRFFREHLDSSNVKDLDQVLLTKLRYGKRTKPHPQGMDDYVHICFVHGLVREDARAEFQGETAEGWDGCFADGLMATNVRATEQNVVGGGPLVSRRGLWIGSNQNSRRLGLTNLLSLLRGARTGELKPGGSLFSRVTLPELGSLKSLYEHSDWVVHLDRELSLDLFRRWGDDAPRIIEYSDQEDPLSPGFDVITVTKNAAPYYEQLDSVLRSTSLIPDSTLGPERHQEAVREGNRLLNDINILSGSWALDFLMGSIAHPQLRTRLLGNVGSALVFRWLRRVEEPALRAKYGDDVVPVYVSLEELIRATPASGFKVSDGMAYRHKQEKSGNKWCDDLLVFYLTPAEKDKEYKLFGRIIEVKFGANALQQESVARDQIRGTYDLLNDHLSGGRSALEAPFRHRQLSLLIKSQLEQAVSSGILDQRQIEALNLPVLSAKLASGGYTVDYLLGDEDFQIYGDAFLLAPSQEVSEDQIVQRESGIRAIRLDRSFLYWLAFENAPKPPSPIPRNTLPDLGHYGTNLKQVVEGTWEKESTLDDEKSEAGVVVEPEPEIPPIVEESEPQDTVEVPIGPSLDFSMRTPVREVTRDGAVLQEILGRIESAFQGQGIRLSEPPSVNEIAMGPRLIRVFVRLEPSEKIATVRNRSEDLARNIGTTTNDIHIVNVPEKRAIALDLPIPGTGYTVEFSHLRQHDSFEAAERELTLGFCAGIGLTGNPVWVDLAKMPHMMVAGTTGSGKTVFLRTLILTLMLHSSPEELDVRLSSSKPMDFLSFLEARHTGGEMAQNAEEASVLVQDLVAEMERRYRLMTEAKAPSLARYNTKVGRDGHLKRVVAVIDEFSETVLSFEDSAQRREFENNVSRLAQKARAAGIHLVLCMQRPDAEVIKGAIKANILHRFALKLPTKTDSSVILDESGAEALLGQGDLLYKADDGSTTRLQVPYLDDESLEGLLDGFFLS